MVAVATTWAGLIPLSLCRPTSPLRGIRRSRSGLQGLSTCRLRTRISRIAGGRPTVLTEASPRTRRTLRQQPGPKSAFVRSSSISYPIDGRPSRANESRLPSRWIRRHGSTIRPREARWLRRGERKRLLDGPGMAFLQNQRRNRPRA